MAEVFRARLHGPEGFEKTLALKLILPHVSEEPEFVRMFIQEATLAAGLDHANIVRIHEFDQVDGRYYIAMELVDGHDLRKLLARSVARDRGLRVTEALAVVLEISRGLAFAHGELAPGRPVVVHRDISPHNIIVSRAGEVKITDFGIAKMANATSMTRTGIIKGKTAYMSPEQARGEPVDGRSDLFSLGCVLWEMLTGQRLFTGDNDLAVIESLQRGRVHPPSNFNPEVPPALDQLMERMLARDPAERVDSAAGLTRAFDRLLYDLAGAERNTLLLDLIGDLFQDPRPGTSVLAAGEGKEDEPPDERGGDPAQDEPPTLANREHVDDRADKAEEQKGASGTVEPVGPLAPTRIRARSVPRPGAATLRWPWLAAGLVLVVLAIATVLVISGLRSPATVPPPKTTVLLASADSGVAEDPAGQGTSASPDASSSPEEAEPALGQPEVPDEPGKKMGSAPATARPTGKLSLNVIPWARVFWRKKLLGETPIENAELPAGRHLLVLVNKELGARRTIRVHIRPGRHTKRVEKLETVE